MPELPEVETCRRGIEPYLINQTITQVHIREYRLRLPIPKRLPDYLCGGKILRIERRGKYLLFVTQQGTLLIHLGMSGSLRIATTTDNNKKHDHFDIHFNNKKILRYHDPRRFGICVWLEDDPHQHPLLSELGPEPLSSAFNTDYLFAAIHHRKIAIKSVIMNSHIVVGVGNIYANEALYYAKISPLKPAQLLTKPECNALTTKIKMVLRKAIKVGGTTLRDFVGGDGKPGYFKQQLQVYGRGGASCHQCQAILIETRLNQRSTIFCPVCQQH